MKKLLAQKTKKSDGMDYLGVDYGTTTSLVTKYMNGEVMHASSPIPSCMALDGAGEIVCGDAALNEYQGRDGFVRSPKRSLNSESSYRDFRNIYGVDCSDVICKTLSLLFGQVMSDSAALTLTVPNAFMDWQCREMTEILRNACNSSGLSLKSFNILPEPVAATIYFIYKNFAPESCPMVDSRGHVLVSDIGGGTTDLAIVEYEYDSSIHHLSVAVRCTAQCASLGGDDFTEAIVSVLRKRRCDTADNGMWRIADYIKRYLTRHESSEYNDIVVSREDFYSSISCLASQYEALLDGMLARFRAEHNGTNPNNLTVIRVGGSSRIPLFSNILREKLPDAFFFNMAENTDDGAVFDSVAMGAALYSAYADSALEMFRSIRIENRTEHSYLMRLSDNRMETCVPANVPDGMYYPSRPIHPVQISSCGVFEIGRLVILQGDGQDGELAAVAEVKLDDELYAHGRCPREINIEFGFEIRNLRLASISVRIPEATDVMQNEKYQQYEKVIEL